MHNNSSESVPSPRVGQLNIDFTDKPMTPWGGVAVLVGKFVERIGFLQWAEAAFPVKETSNNAGGVGEKLLAQFLTLLCGGDRFAHCGWWEHSREILRRAFGVSWLPSSSSTLTRFWSKIGSQALSEAWLEQLRAFALKMVQEAAIQEDCLSLDSTVAVRYGSQDGAARGYNPKKPGRKSHHPLLAALGKGFVVNLWNRGGDTYSGNSAVNFLEQTLTLLAGHVRISRILADSGFYLVQVLDWAEAHGLQYIIAVRQDPLIQKQLEKLLVSGEWTQIEPGLAVSEFRFKHLDAKWTHERRYIVIRQDAKLRPNATGKQPSLFEDVEDFSHYRFTVLVTNDEVSSPHEIWKHYRQRANIENTIKELKEGYGLASFSKKNFWATEAVMATNALVFHNLILYLNRHILTPTGPLQQLKSLRSRWFAIPAILGRDGRASVMRIGLPEPKQRQEIMQCFDLIGELGFQLQCS